MKRPGRLPRWLQDLLHVSAAAKSQGRLPSWQEPLWPHVWVKAPRRLLIRGILHFPPERGAAEIRVAQAGARCGIGAPVTSAMGVHGLDLFLIDERRSARVSVLLLTPAAFDRFQENSGQSRLFSLAEPVVVLEMDDFRAEFIVRSVDYDPAQPELELVEHVALEVVLWLISPTAS